MKKLLLLFGCLSISTANAQNGFTPVNSSIAITSVIKVETSLLVDNSGNKWIGFKAAGISGNVGLAKFDNFNWTYYSKFSSPALPSNGITALAKDNSGNIWIGTDSGLVKFDGTAFTTFNTSNGLPAKLVKCIDVIGNQVYIGTAAGLSRFDGVSFYNYNMANSKLPYNNITAIKSESSSVIWLGGNDRLVQFNINTSTNISSYTDHIISPSTGTINCIHVDSQNAKWLGTTNVGVLTFNGSAFVNANSQYLIYGGVIPNKVMDITEGLNNGVMFKMAYTKTSSSSNGLIELAPNENVFQYYTTGTVTTMGDFIEKDGNNIVISQASQAYPKMYYVFDKTNYISTLGEVNANNFKSLDINNVRAGIANRGDMHWNVGGDGNPLYEVPKGSGKHSNFASALWVAGLDNGNQLHGAAQTYRQGGVDFWPGPLDTIAATIDTATSKNYDKIWKVSYTDINTFINAYNSGSVVATPDMLTWPAHGIGSNSRNLAPFVDHNGDGLYNPNDGDYPKIKGDQTLYFIFNDKLAAHSTSFTPMGIEVHGMAYSYGCPTVVSGKPELSYTTFYDYKIINRSSLNYHDVYISMLSDVDVGYYGDDYIGSDIGDNYGYAYNADANDETTGGVTGYGAYIPAQGFNIVKGPIANINDGIDNNNNGITDEPGEDCKLNKLTYFNNAFPGFPVQTLDPVNGQEYYNYMTGYWKDGTAFTCGGNGYGGTIPTSYVYTADTYTNGVCGATPWYESAVPGDRRMILSSGPFNLNAGQMQEVEYAFVTSFDSSTVGGMAALPKLKSDIQKINTFYNQVNKPTCLQSLITGITEVPQQTDFVVYPNPAKSMISIASTIIGSVKINYEIVDVLGKKVLANENNSGKFSININDLNSGIYFLRLQVNNSVVVKKFVKE
ncbi:MAG: T9SS type A sorting domain-containing protein [Bacteroidota bacterium]